MGVLAPETWFVNKTESTMVLVIEDELGFNVSTEFIEPGGHVDVGYRKGIDRIGPRVHFWVHPKNRPDLRGPKIMPIDVYDYADIGVVYKLGGFVSGRYRIGALVGFEFKKDTTFRRIGLVRWCGGAFDSLANFGNCYYQAPPAPAPAPVPDPSPDIENVINEHSPASAAYEVSAPIDPHSEVQVAIMN